MKTPGIFDPNYVKFNQNRRKIKKIKIPDPDMGTLIMDNICLRPAKTWMSLYLFVENTAADPGKRSVNAPYGCIYGPLENTLPGYRSIKLGRLKDYFNSISFFD